MLHIKQCGIMIFGEFQSQSKQIKKKLLNPMSWFSLEVG